MFSQEYILTKKMCADEAEGLSVPATLHPHPPPLPPGPYYFPFWCVAFQASFSCIFIQAGSAETQGLKSTHTILCVSFCSLLTSLRNMS